jgi:hypothetical protein
MNTTASFSCAARLIVERGQSADAVIRASGNQDAAPCHWRTRRGIVASAHHVARFDSADCATAGERMAVVLTGSLLLESLLARSLASRCLFMNGFFAI